MSAMASQITGVSIVYSTVWSGADQTKHQSSVSHFIIYHGRLSGSKFVFAEQKNTILLKGTEPYKLAVYNFTILTN